MTELRSSQEWWESVRADEAALVSWLKDQYHGEVTAAGRIQQLLDDYEVPARESRILTKIVQDEVKHAEWVKELLVQRGIAPQVLDKEERYWDKVLPKDGNASFEQMCAIGHHAEDMRLARIRVIAADTEHKELAAVFGNILHDELYHAEAFKSMSTEEAIAETAENHNKGLNALGLVA